MTLNSRSADPNTWTLTRAKAEFSELVERAQACPQIITRHGEPKAVMVSAQEWRRKTVREGTLAEFLLASPLRDAAMDIERIRDRPRPIVNPDYRPWGESELLDPSWPRHEPLPDTDRLAGPIYRLLDRAGGAFVHIRSFLERCRRVESEKREAKRPEMERRVVQEVGPDGTRETPFLELLPDYFDFVPREVRFFQDWEQSSAGTERVFAHWALDIRDYTYKGEREIGFIPRPLRAPQEKLRPSEDVSVHLLMDRIEAIDREVRLPFGWYFLMTHGNYVDPDVGRAIARGLRDGRVRLPDRDATVLLRWSESIYGF